MPHVLFLVVSISVCNAAPEDGGARTSSSDRCIIEGKKHDRVAKGQDVVINAGERVDDAIAVEGNVIVRRGARVKQAVALHGSVTVEAGAQVTGSVLALGGKIQVSPEAEIQGSQLSLHDGLHIVGENGREIRLNLSLDGENVAQEILKPMLQKFRDCGVISIK